MEEDSSRISFEQLRLLTPSNNPYVFDRLRVFNAVVEEPSDLHIVASCLCPSLEEFTLRAYDFSLPPNPDDMPFPVQKYVNAASCLIDTIPRSSPALRRLILHIFHYITPSHTPGLVDMLRVLTKLEFFEPSVSMWSAHTTRILQQCAQLATLGFSLEDCDRLASVPPAPLIHITQLTLGITDEMPSDAFLRLFPNMTSLRVYMNHQNRITFAPGMWHGLCETISNCVPELKDLAIMIIHDAPIPALQPVFNWTVFRALSRCVLLESLELRYDSNVEADLQDFHVDGLTENMSRLVKLCLSTLR